MAMARDLPYPDPLRSWWPRIALVLFCISAVGIIWVTNQVLTQRFAETVSNRAQVRYTLYVGQLVSELQRNSIVPQLLARDPELVNALQMEDFSRSSQRLLSLVEEIGAASILLYDRDGRVVAATERTRLGEAHGEAASFLDALRVDGTVFTTIPGKSGGHEFLYSRRVADGGNTLGVISVEVDLAKLEQSWARTQDAVMVADANGEVLLATEPRWRGLPESEALSLTSTPSSVERALRVTQDWARLSPDAYVSGEAVMRRELRVPFRGWRLVGFTAYASVRERVNGVLALEIMAFAILLALAFWVNSRKTRNRLVTTQRESADLRLLNARLSREIASASVWRSRSRSPSRPWRNPPSSPSWARCRRR